MTTQPEPDRLHHLIDRLRRGVLLEAEAAQLATAVTMLLARLADQDGAADIAVRAIRLMNEAGVQRDAAEARIRELEAAAPEVDRRPLHARHVAALTDAYPDLRHTADHIANLILGVRDEHVRELEQRVAELTAGQCTHKPTP
ncbi:hypothetical protein AB0D56_09860 [Streptomyces sp. NPDC048209]|uniref:hypothetical protein n=1 Tax=Streptomyces sp. NPDC048209 TaxID=3156689 RepID=UPI0034328F2D